MKQYLDLLKHILEKGEPRDNERTGVGTISVFGYQTRFDLRDGFPLVTTKFVPFRLIAEELLWFLRGSTDQRELAAKNVHIWDEWATAEKTAKFGRREGDLGPVYGFLWRNFGGSYDKRVEPHVCYVCANGLCQTGSECYSIENDRREEWPTPQCTHICNENRIQPIVLQKHGKGIDQIARLMHDLEHNPGSRRHLVSGWDPASCDKVELPPCHTVWQCYVHNDNSMSLELYARSIDAFLGLPFNIASYALLLSMLAHCTGRTARELIISFGDLHLYKNHLPQVELQLSRVPYSLPDLEIDDWHGQFKGLEGLLNITYQDLILHEYLYHPKIKAEVAI